MQTWHGFLSETHSSRLRPPPPQRGLPPGASASLLHPQSRGLGARAAAAGPASAPARRARETAPAPLAGRSVAPVSYNRVMKPRAAAKGRKLFSLAAFCLLFIAVSAPVAASADASIYPEKRYRVSTSLLENCTRVEGTLSPILQKGYRWSSDRIVVGSLDVPGREARTLITHRGGNRQVMVGQDVWHLPKGKSAQDIPLHDPIGDQLQAAASEIAGGWHKGLISDDYIAAMRRANARGKGYVVPVLEARAKGQYVERMLKIRFPDLPWSSRGVDVPGARFGYEILSGTTSNMNRHGRRVGMTSEFYRMIRF